MTVTGKLSHYRLADAVIQSIRDEIESQSNGLIKGQPQDYAEYRFAVGQIAGLLLAIDIAESTERDWQQS